MRKLLILRDLSTFRWLVIALMIIAVIYLIRVLLVDVYHVASDSMENTLHKDDFIWIDKVSYGARLSLSDFGIPIQSENPTRIRGIAKVNFGDLIVFNYPLGNQSLAQKAVYVKRCVGLPGDTVTSIGGYIETNHVTFDTTSTVKRNFILKSSVPISHLLPSKEVSFSKIYSTDSTLCYNVTCTQGELRYMVVQARLRGSSFQVTTGQSGDIEPGFLKKINKRWTSQNFGPLIIPRKCMTINFPDPVNAGYIDIIAGENPGKTVLIDSILQIGKQSVRSYTFRNDYFFVLGDNRLNSQDSRFWGLVPFDHIIGKVMH